MLGRPSGCLTDSIKKDLLGVVSAERKARKQPIREVEGELLVKLYDKCQEVVSDPEEAKAVVRRFLSIEYRMVLDEIDRRLAEVGLLESEAVAMAG